MIVDAGCWERGCACYDDRIDKDGVAVVKKEWVGLGSDDDILEMSKDVWGRDKLDFGRADHHSFYVAFAREVDKYLKEKNA